MSSIKLVINADDVDEIDIKIIVGNTIGTLHLKKQGIAFEKPSDEKIIHYTNWDRLPILLNGKIPHV